LFGRFLDPTPDDIDYSEPRGGLLGHGHQKKKPR